MPTDLGSRIYVFLTHLPGAPHTAKENTARRKLPKKSRGLNFAALRNGACSRTFVFEKNFFFNKTSCVFCVRVCCVGLALIFFPPSFFDCV